MNKATVLLISWHAALNNEELEYGTVAQIIGMT